MFWMIANARSLDLSAPRIMAILNVTPDSFADGGKHASPAAAADAVAKFVEEGADIIDVGGESTRPGAARVDAPEQLRRVIPVIRAIRALQGPAGRVPISIDTTLSPVASAALDAGADAINDVSGGTEDANMLPLAAESGAGIVLMHRLAAPPHDSYSDRYTTPPPYTDAVAEIIAAFQERLVPAARRAGVRDEQIVADPGLGFGKSVEQNLELIRRTSEITAALQRPILSGLSRKSFVGRVALGRDSTPDERLAGTLAMSVAHLAAGARLFRVHDVAAHAQALRAAAAVLPKRQATGHTETESPLPIDSA